MILIIGCNGQLGSCLMNIVKDRKSFIGEVNGLYKNNNVYGISREELDITDMKAVRSYLSEYGPSLVINTAAYTNVEGCEEEKELAFKVNSLGPRNLAIACSEVDAKLIHISTDYVFQGDASKPYCEYDVTNPVSIYGKTKLLGEKYVQEFCSKYFIVRTSWLYGYEGNNFVKTIMKYATERSYLDVVNDQVGNPTNSEDLAYHILKLSLTDEYGIYHCTGIGECSWYDFACKIIEFSGINCKVNPITSEQYKSKVKRPAYSSLDNMMLRCTVGDKMRNWEEALLEFISNIKN